MEKLDWFIVTGCYDSLARVWKAAGESTRILEGHSDVIASVGVINRKGVEGITVATASQDRTLRLWKFDTKDSINNPIRIRAFKILRGHTKSVQCVAAQNTGDMVCSGSWDSTIKLWQTNDSQSDGDLVSIKKRKGNDQADESQLEGEAVSTLVGHTQCVSSMVWPQQETIYSASWDHSVRLWDAETGKNSSDITYFLFRIGLGHSLPSLAYNSLLHGHFCTKVLNCLDVGGESSALIAAGGSDPILSIWDPHKPGTSAPVFQFSSHTSWISACKWHDKSWFHLISSSYDGKVMLWDLRTAWSLAVIESHKDKVLCTDWWKGDSVISGGADSKLCISSGISVL